MAIHPKVTETLHSNPKGKPHGCAWSKSERKVSSSPKSVWFILREICTSVQNLMSIHQVDDEILYWQHKNSDLLVALEGKSGDIMNVYITNMSHRYWNMSLDQSGRPTSRPLDPTKRLKFPYPSATRHFTFKFTFQLVNRCVPKGWVRFFVLFTSLIRHFLILNNNFTNSSVHLIQAMILQSSCILRPN